MTCIATYRTTKVLPAPSRLDSRNGYGAIPLGPDFGALRLSRRGWGYEPGSRRDLTRSAEQGDLVGKGR